MQGSITKEMEYAIKEDQKKKIDQILKEEIQYLHQQNPPSKARHVAEKYLNLIALHKKKCIDAIIPNGLPIFSFILLCSTPEFLGWKDSTCGGSSLEGFDYADCDSAIGLQNIITAFKQMNLCQFVDETEAVPVDANNARKCDVPEGVVIAMRAKKKRWSCRKYTPNEARRTARFMDPYIEASALLGVHHVVIDAGGVGSNSYDVAENLDQNNISVLIGKLYHIQFFKSLDRVKTFEQIKDMSDAFEGLSSLRGVEQSKSFADVFCQNAKGRSFNEVMSTAVERRAAKKKYGNVTAAERRATKEKDRKEEEHWTSVLRELEYGLLCNDEATLSKTVSSATAKALLKCNHAL